jgi:hypothetical protein
MQSLSLRFMLRDVLIEQAEEPEISVARCVPVYTVNIAGFRSKFSSNPRPNDA